MVPEIKLDEKEHALSILLQLNSMKQGHEKCDFVVAVDGDEYHAHKNILSAASEYFKDMLSSDTVENQIGRAEMIGLDSECVRACIDFIYSGKVDIPEGKIEETLHVASVMKLSLLCDGIGTALATDLSPSTYYKKKSLGETYQCEMLLRICQKYRDTHFLPISAQKEFPEESMDDVFATLSGNTNLTSADKLMITVKWIGQEPARENLFPNILKCINLDDVPISYRRHLMQNYRLIKDDIQMFKIFALSVCDTAEVPDLDMSEFFKKKSIMVFEKSSMCLLNFSLKENKGGIAHTASFPFSEGFSAVYLFSCIYILQSDQAVYRLQFTNRNAKWERMRDMLKNHGLRPSVVVDSDVLYVSSGKRCQSLNQDQFTPNAMERYLPQQNVWERLTDKERSIEQSTIVALNGSIYSIGGCYYRGSSVTTFSRLDLQSAKWIRLPPMKNARRSCGSVAVDPNIFVLGGNTEYLYYQDAECYDTGSAQWTTLPGTIKYKDVFKVFHVDGSMYVVGGDELQSQRLMIKAYDLNSSQWKELDNSFWVGKVILESVVFPGDT